MAEYKTGGYKISNIYQGGYSSLNPEMSEYFPTGSFGLTTDPRTANILKEVSQKLSTGVKHIEVEALSPDIFDSIPKQQLKEVNRLAKLTGVDVSLHGPVMNVSGLDPRSGFSESERELAEKRVEEYLKRSQQINPEGNIPVNFHSAEGIPGSQPLPPSKRKPGEEYKTLVVVNRETGQLAPLPEDIQYMPGQEKIEAKKISPEEQLEILNRNEWDNKISQLIFNKERAGEILEKNRPFIQHLIEDIESGRVKEKDFVFSPDQQKAVISYQDAKTYLDDVHKQVNTLFSKAYEFGTKEQKERLDEINKEFSKIVKNQVNPFVYAEAMHQLLHSLDDPRVIPKMYEPIEKFALEKSSQTFGNAAWQAYQKLQGKNVPILTIENPPAGFGLSTGEDLKNLIEKSREQFIKDAIESGMSEGKAQQEAKKLIGATWDVGHINMLRKYGYTEEEIVKEAEKVAPYLKHVHLSDNFGFEHTELPMGMGNVPLKQIMEKLGEKGFDVRKIIEAGTWWQHFQTPPVQETFEATGSPVYAMKAGPYWNQAPGLYQGYLQGMEGQWFPQINYETFGGSFSRLPKELGGSVQGAPGSRMSGRGME